MMMAGEVCLHFINNTIKGTHSFNAGSDRTSGVTSATKPLTLPVGLLENYKLATNITVVIVSMTAQFVDYHTDIVEQCSNTDTQIVTLN